MTAERPAPESRGRLGLAPPLAVLAASAWMLRGWRERWIPHDEGTLAGSAQRVLEGQLPHRDFDEVYTGGLAALHATLLAWEPRLSTLRLPLLAAALLVLAPCLYALARRFSAPWPAAAIAVAAFAWGVPNYPAALPSWFHLILSVAAFTALLRGSEGRGWGWRLAAGLCVGASISIKISGLYTLAGALLFCALEEQRRAAESPGDRRASLLPLHGTAAVVLGLALVRLLGPSAAPAELAQFLLPPLAAGWLVVQGEWHAPGPFGLRARSLARQVAPVLAGTFAACLPLVAVYAYAGALGDLYRGLFVTPLERLEHAALAPPPLRLAVWALPWALLLALAPRFPRACMLLASAGLAGACALLPQAAGADAYMGIWHTVRPLPALLVLAGAWRARRESAEPNGLTGSALLVATAFGVLIQFPFASPLYFTYVAPLAVLLAAWLARPLGRYVAAPGLVFAVLFPVLWLHTSTLSDFGWGAYPQGELRELATPRGHLRVHVSEAEIYDRVLAELEQEAADGPLLAGPDSPEFAFLSGRTDVTDGPFGFFQTGGESALARWLRDTPPAAVIVNNAPSFSPPYSQDAVESLLARYTRWRLIGPFLVGTQAR